MKGRKKGLRAISWVLIFAMVIQMMSSDLITIAKAMPADGISAEVTELSSEVSGNTADESVVPSE